MGTRRVYFHGRAILNINIFLVDYLTSQFFRKKRRIYEDFVKQEMLRELYNTLIAGFVRVGDGRRAETVVNYLADIGMFSYYDVVFVRIKNRS